MTREEARIELQAMKDDFEEYEPGGSRCQMALKIALTALRPITREQVEKVCRGEWQYHPEDYDELTWTCSRCGEVWTLIDGTPDDNNMDFCPACGSPMTDEAVQMVMKRMEVLKDASD